MNKLYLSCLFVCLNLLFISCDDSIDPKTAPEEGYVVFCLINCDTTFQTAYVSKTYDVEGLEPGVNKSDPAITDAAVSVKYLSNDYLFNNAVAERTDTSRYSNGFHYYFNNSLNVKSKYINDTPKPITIKVALPGGGVLTSNSETIPAGDVMFEKYLYMFPAGNNPKTSEFKWRFFLSQNLIKKYYFLPSLKIEYSRENGGISTPMTFEIPLKKIYTENKEVPVYPVVTQNNYVNYVNDYITKGFLQLSEGDPVKSNYTINKLVFKIVLMDKNIASYYASNGTFEDEFSVRIEAADVSNINGGYGLFGVYAARTKEVKLDTNYIRTLGYKIGSKL